MMVVSGILKMMKRALAQPHFLFFTAGNKMKAGNRVNNEANPAFTAVVAQAVANLLPTLTARITDEIRQNENNGNNDSPRNARRYFPYLEKERCKGEYKLICQLPEETSTDFMKRFLRLAGFLGAKVANAIRNIKIFHDRSKTEGNNKRDRDSQHMATETCMEVTEGVVIDREVIDKVIAVTDGILVLRGRGVTRISRFKSNSMVVLMGHQDREDNRIMPHLPPCNICGKLHPGKACHRATGACFECEEVWHMAKDCKKDFALSVSTPIRNNVVISHEFRNCPLRFDDKVRSANLLPLEMSDFDIILGMDWLTEHCATIDCHTKSVIFGNLNNLEFIYQGSRPGRPIKIISALKARTLISHNCKGFLASIKDTLLDGPHLESHPVFQKFLDVFPDEFLGLPPERVSQIHY
nr:reverse transcriptase domain-containing protein [Tanacetum cinerariifolium]